MKCKLGGDSWHWHVLIGSYITQSSHPISWSQSLIWEDNKVFLNVEKIWFPKSVFPCVKDLSSAYQRYKLQFPEFCSQLRILELKKDLKILGHPNGFQARKDVLDVGGLKLPDIHYLALIFVQILYFLLIVIECWIPSWATGGKPAELH